MPTTPKTSRKVTYRRGYTPAIILEGQWLTKKYGWKIGDVVKVEYLPTEIRLSKEMSMPMVSNDNLSTNKKALPGGSTSILEPCGSSRNRSISYPSEKSRYEICTIHNQPLQPQ